MPEAVFGWDIGGAHVKAACWADGQVQDVAQWPCPLWKGLEHLDAALDAAAGRWPQLGQAAHAVTMTGEMADCFAHREDGVARIAARLAARLPAPRFFAGERWCGASDAGANWPAVASANWLATARHAAAALAPEAGLLVDIGSTTTDLIAFGGGRVAGASRRDVDRLASGELVYHGVVRTPLCALARRIPWRGRPLNVMNEFFATTADVYRLSGELDPAHDQHPAADGAAKDAAGSRARLARMIGLDARDADDAEWDRFALAWRAEQRDELRGQLARVAAANGLPRDAVAVAAGCGAFLVPEIVPPGWRVRPYVGAVAALAPQAPAEAASWAQVAAPAVAVAALYAREAGRCGS
ncbi:H4MPT-linked C1 transfer pathway protein [Rubrivivax gelatinosus]|nr:H4MPT-linked C1 transfer pathway protein [Rubrivivax gelatinosus]